MLTAAVSRLEDKESETKKEYVKLHERYTDVRICSLLFLAKCCAITVAFFTYVLMQYCVMTVQYQEGLCEHVKF